MNWTQLKRWLTEPIFSKKVDPFVFSPLAFIAAWISTIVYQKSGMSYFEYIVWLIPVLIVIVIVSVLLLVLVKSSRADNEK